MSENKIAAEKTAGRKLTPYLSPAAAWALSLGTSIGWGSLVITSSTYLSQAGPVGSVLGMIVGAVIILISVFFANRQQGASLE